MEYGATTRIDGDMWLPKLPRKCASPRAQEGGGMPERVSDLIVEGCWNLSMIKEVLNQVKADEILSIPLPRFPQMIDGAGITRRMVSSLCEVLTSLPCKQIIPTKRVPRRIK